MEEILNLNLECDFEYRVINRDDESVDIFVDLGDKTLNIIDESSKLFSSRIQFPKVRAILLRITYSNYNMTVHILRDIDLFSAFSNFETYYKDSTIRISKYKEYAYFKRI
ncbi:hypothetical protein [Peptostreptococcus faecalis]|uniref:hypothetical protein n=1 Tax=Peptostreptococcus faecalis TaxID=2045015 RepID=UPI000C7A6F10|nr:hypothetical protein [Peptostreptococcus faecalis]